MWGYFSHIRYRIIRGQVINGLPPRLLLTLLAFARNSVLSCFSALLMGLLLIRAKLHHLNCVAALSIFVAVLKISKVYILGE